MQGGHEGAGRLGQRVGRDLAPREALERGQGEGHRGIEVGAAQPRRHVDAQGDAETPGPGDAVVVSEAARRVRQGPAGDHLGHDTAAEEDENHGAGELGRQFADQP